MQLPVVTQVHDEENDIGVCLSGFKPYENGFYHSPLQLSGSLFKCDYDSIWHIDDNKSSNDVM